MKSNIRPVVKLVGEDGNAFAILGRCRNAAKKAGWTEDQLTEFSTKARSGDYNNLLCTVMDYFDVQDDEDEEDFEDEDFDDEFEDDTDA